MSDHLDAGTYQLLQLIAVSTNRRMARHRHPLLRALAELALRLNLGAAREQSGFLVLCRPAQNQRCVSEGRVSYSKVRAMTAWHRRQ